MKILREFEKDCFCSFGAMDQAQIHPWPFLCTWYRFFITSAYQRNFLKNFFTQIRVTQELISFFEPFSPLCVVWRGFILRGPVTRTHIFLERKMGRRVLSVPLDHRASGSWGIPRQYVNRLSDASIRFSGSSVFSVSAPRVSRFGVVFPELSSHGDLSLFSLTSSTDTSFARVVCRFIISVCTSSSLPWYVGCRVSSIFSCCRCPQYHFGALLFALG